MTPSAHRVITAFFTTRTDADRARAEVLASGALPHDISVIEKNVLRRDDLGVAAGSKAPRGAALGALLGGVLGALGFAATAAGSLIVPGAGVVVAGPLVALLCGAGAGGALGGLVGALVGAGIPEFEARYLNDAVGEGGALVAVRCRSERAATTERILAAAGARLLRRARAHSPSG